MLTMKILKAKKNFQNDTLLFNCYVSIHNKMNRNIIHFPNNSILRLKIILYVKNMLYKWKS